MSILSIVKRLIYGATSFFCIKKGSCALSGKSFVPIYEEMTKLPMEIHSLEFTCEEKIPKMFRITVDGEKVFPYTDESQIQPNKTMFVTPVKIAVGSYLQIEVKSTISEDKSVIILSELCIVEER